MRLPFVSVLTFSCLLLAAQEPGKLPEASEKPRVFITDSESWSIAGQSGGAGGAYGGAMAGGARPQTAEIIKTFGERCPQVVVNNIQGKADYIVLLDHEGGKGALRHKNKVAVFARISGDSIVSKSTLSLGGSVQDACEGIERDWQAHGAAMRAADQTRSTPTAQPANVAAVGQSNRATAKVLVGSSPDGADIEVDGSFVGNTPSEVQLTEGEHTIAVKKPGFKDWERKLKVTAGSDVHLNAALELITSQ